MKKEGKKAFFLVFALWLMLILSLFCLGLGFRTYISTRKTKLILNNTRSFYLSFSGIKIGRGLLIKDKDDSLSDHLGEDWARSPSFESEYRFTSPFSEGSLKVMISDESARININKADPTILKTLFSGLENSQEAVESFLYYCGKAESFETDASRKGEELYVLEELLLVQGIDLEAYDSLKDFITVDTSDAKININTVDRRLLNSLIDSLGLLDPQAAKAEIFDVLDREEGYFGPGRDMFPPAALQEDDKKKLSNLFKTNTDIFRIISEAEVRGCKKKITCVVDRNRDRLETLYWYEE
ncbi:MAG: general secretion pathway protein GspK [Candidatus Omnitrophica bacterium]|nr:general secretion pathway protein GspK [Candidatus Omnitrophota bacterium]